MKSPTYLSRFDSRDRGTLQDVACRRLRGGGHQEGKVKYPLSSRTNGVSINHDERGVPMTKEKL